MWVWLVDSRSAGEVSAVLARHRTSWTAAGQGHVFAALDQGRLNKEQQVQLLTDIEVHTTSDD